MRYLFIFILLTSWIYTRKNRESNFKEYEYLTVYKADYTVDDRTTIKLRYTSKEHLPILIKPSVNIMSIKTSDISTINDEFVLSPDKDYEQTIVIDGRPYRIMIKDILTTYIKDTTYYKMAVE